MPGGIAAIEAASAAQGDAVLARFFHGTFVAGGLYDILPIMALSATAARISGVSYGQIVRETAAWMAERHLRGLYRPIPSLGSVENVAMRLGTLSAQFFDFGKAEPRRLCDHVVESRRSGIPVPVASWYVLVANGFVPVALKLAGARSVRLRHREPVPDGTVHGVQAVQIRFEIQWQ